MPQADTPRNHISNPAKLLRALIHATGITDCKQLSEMLSIPVRTLQRLKLEVAETVDTATANDAKHAIYGAATSANDAISGASGASRTHARIETPYGVTLTEEVKEDPPLVPQGQTEAKKVLLQDESLNEARKAYTGVTMAGGVIALHNGTRQFWLDRFGGDAERLNLALIQAAAYVQPNSNRPLETQVGSQLARIAGEKREKDQRYATAAKARPAATATPPKKTVRQILAEMSSEAVQ
jgi:hypothetical protein